MQQLKTNRVELFATAAQLIGPLSFSLTAPDALPPTATEPASFTSSTAATSASTPPVDCAVLFVTEEQASSQSLPLSSLASLLSHDALNITATQWSDFKAKSKQTLFLYPAAPSLPRLLLVGLGKQASLSLSTLRSATHAMVGAMKAKRVRHALLVVPEGEVHADEEDQKAGLESVLDVLVRIAVLSNHSFAKYLTRNLDGEKAHQLEHLSFVHPSFVASKSTDSESSVSPYDAVVTRSATIAECTLFSRDLANDRADTITPSAIEALAQKLATAHQLPFTVVKGDALHTEGLTLIEAVGQGAKEGEKARIVILRYVGNTDSQDCIALVGKTITFDTGGLNMKHTGNIEDMYLDKSGGCAVLAVMKCLALLQPKLNVVVALAVAENSVDAHSIKPHTILHTVKGSVEIGNTDAEGRLALADAFTYVQRYYHPHTIIDVATLTGACVVALGEQIGGLFSNDRTLAALLLSASVRSAEPLHQLPIHQSHVDGLKRQYADFGSTGKGKGGACVAAAFIRKFVDDGVKWSHADIAGPAMLSEASEWRPKGGTGFGVQLLVDFLLAEEKEGKLKTKTAGKADKADRTTSTH